MELWTEARALKASLRGEAIKHQVVVSEELSRTSSAEDFSVECFLDFSEEVQEEEEELVSVSSSQEEQDCCIFSSQPCIFDQLPALPDEDVEELEWVSRVVDDCSSQEVSLLLTQAHKTKPSFSSRVPVKPRTKRPRNSLTGDRVWPLVSTNQHAAGQQHWNKKKKKQELAVVFQRRCSHCGTNTTPQWRTGPVGPKTLCNACGVRFKSGRLCPEYRPADSPTFSNEIHSNLHRKVLELRKSKELVEETGGAITKSDQVKSGSQVVE
ncbi:GATA transcription factor 3 [Hirschfeldia incana]|nr:GATA transcription factor 3 [Hirschfeldia incana]KAJ0252122.1 GATA transcription factor 3 [Hirschfeldia incana]KAJ0252123.1 GATA transcription factor 3 [Hirschfeldia incana]